MAIRSPNTAKGAVHKALIARILKHYPNARTKGFMTALKQLPDAEYVPDLLIENEAWRRYINMIPDAYLIDASSRRVLIFEAVHRHDVTVRKFGQMVDLAWALDEDCYTLILVRVDGAGVSVYEPMKAYIAYNRDQAMARNPTTPNDIEPWARYTIGQCDAALADLGPDPIVGMINLAIAGDPL